MSKSKSCKFVELQQIAENFYQRGRYTKAKKVYEAMLTLTRDNTDKQNRVLSCISDMNIAIKKNLNKGIDEAVKETELTDKIKDITK